MYIGLVSLLLNFMKSVSYNMSEYVFLLFSGIFWYPIKNRKHGNRKRPTAPLPKSSEKPKVRGKAHLSRGIGESFEKC